MTITYTWKVTGLKTRDEGDLENAVIQTYWEKIGTDEDGVEGKFAGATPFNVDPNGEFIPFNQLTEEQVLSWIKVEAAKYEDHIDGQIAKQIALKKVPVQENVQMPWASNTPPV